MVLRSALEDFTETTLAMMAGVLAKLRYLAGLYRQVNGPYIHWGLSRTHGEAAAQQAISDSHREIFLRVLRTPLRQLRQDIQISSASSGMAEPELLHELSAREKDLLPLDLGGGSPRHFNSVLQALLALTSRPAKTPPDATRQS
jgi:hypothetical protein